MAELPPTTVSASDLHDLAISVGQLTEEARILRQAIDELRDDVVWSAREVLAAGDCHAPGHLRRQYDPLAPDSAPMAIDRAASAPAEGVESVEYCCEVPRLTWNGDPAYPGVACENCGFVIADQGSAVIWRTDDPVAAQRVPAVGGQSQNCAQQGNLF